MHIRSCARNLLGVVALIASVPATAETSLPRIAPADFVSTAPGLCYDVYCYNWLMAMSGNVAVQTSSSGVVGVMTRTATNSWVGNQALFNPDEGGFPNGPPDPEVHTFGAPIAIDGRVMLVGGGSELHPAGAVYVFTRPAQTWVHSQTIVMPDGSAPGAFMMNGNTALIAGSTKVYEYTRQTGQPYVLTDELPPFEGGYIGFQDNVVVTVSGGAVLVYWRTTDGWTLKQRLTGSDTQPGDNFGDSVAFHDKTIVVSAPQRPNSANPLLPGAIYTFTRRRELFVERDILVHEPMADITPLDPEVAFGKTLALSGKRLLVSSGRLIGDPPLVTLYERRNERWIAAAHLGCLNIREIEMSGTAAVISYGDFSRPGSSVVPFELPPLGTPPPATSYECP